MSGTRDLSTLCLEVEALRHQAVRMQDSVLVVESRVKEAIAELATLDDPAARRACALAKRALTDLHNAHYGALLGYETSSDALIRAIPR